MLNIFARRRNRTRADACTWVSQDPIRRDIGHRTWGGQIVYATDGNSTYKAVHRDGGRPVRDLDYRDDLYNGIRCFWQEAKYTLRLQKRPQPITISGLAQLIVRAAVPRIRS